MNYMRLYNFGEISITKSLYYLYWVYNRFSSEIRVPILAYHNICEVREKENYPPFYVRQSLFEEQMNFLYNKGYSVISLYEFLLFCEGKKQIPQKPVVLTFDDGYKNVYRHAYPILNHYRYPATIFLAAGHIGRTEPFPWLKLGHKLDEQQVTEWLPLSWREIYKMNSNLITFGSHSYYHTPFRALSIDQIEMEFRRSKEYIEGKTGNQVDLFSFPFSASNLRHKHRTKLLSHMLKQYGYKAACTTRIGINKKNADPFAFNRLQINHRDSLSTFRAKVNGAYSWVRLPQLIHNWHLRYFY